MKIQASALLMSMVLVTALGGCAASASPPRDRAVSPPIQYSQDPYYYPQDRYYPGDRRGGYYPPPRDADDGPLWRPGDVLPPNAPALLSMIGISAASSARRAAIYGFAQDTNSYWFANAIG